MNQKAYSVLFCALLASTFVHELRAKGVAPVSSRVARGLERPAPQTCQLTCTVRPSENVTFGITIQVVDEVLVLANLSSNAALLINASSEIVVLLNGTTGSGVALNLTSQTGVYVSSGLWLASKTTIDVYIRSLSGGLQSIFSISGAVSFSLKSVSKVILTEINLIISRLVINIGLSISQDILVGLQIVLSISGGIIKLLRGNLRGLLALIGLEIIIISLDIAALLSILLGIETIIVKAYGSLEALIAAGVKLSWSRLLAARNGLILLADLLLAINITAVTSLFDSAENIFSLLAQLGGNSTVGINGIFTVVANLVALTHGSIKLEAFLQILILFVVNSNRYIHADLTVELKESLRGLLLVIERVKGSSQLSELVVIITALVAGDWVYKSVNIGAIILQLAAGVALQRSKLLQVIILVLLRLTAVVKLNIAIAALVLTLILNLHTAFGVWLLISLGISISASGSGSLLKNLLSNASGLILGLLTGNLYSTLAAISGIGTIIKALKEAYEAVASGQISFITIINRESTLKVQILALFQFVGGIRLGSSSSAVSAISVQLKELTSVSIYTGISVSSSSSISVSS